MPHAIPPITKEQPKLLESLADLNSIIISLDSDYPIDLDSFGWEVELPLTELTQAYSGLVAQNQIETQL